MSDLSGKTLFITGASRGIGRAIALRAARDGANVAVAAKTAEPHPRLPGTIHTVAEEIEAAGGRALALQTDIRFEDQVVSAVERTVERFGGVDVLVNNASAIFLAGTLETPLKRFDLMWSVNARGTWLCSRACLPHLLEAANPHILTLSPPHGLEPRWFAPHGAYTMAKYGMTLFTLGLAEEYRDAAVAANCLWPRTVIATAALAMLPASWVDADRCRKPEIVADAAHAILVRDSRRATGECYVDEEVLRAEGVADFAPYAVDPDQELLPDLFLDARRAPAGGGED